MSQKCPSILQIFFCTLFNTGSLNITGHMMSSTSSSSQLSQSSLSSSLLLMLFSRQFFGTSNCLSCIFVVAQNFRFRLPVLNCNVVIQEEDSHVATKSNQCILDFLFKWHFQNIALNKIWDFQVYFVLLHTHFGRAHKKYCLFFSSQFYYGFCFVLYFFFGMSIKCN